MENNLKKTLCDGLLHGLKVEISDGIYTFTGEIGVHNILMNISRSKPYLRGIGDLVNPITHKGETFVPLGRLKELYPNTPNLDYFIKANILDFHIKNGLTKSVIEWCIVNQLIEWMFNVHNLPPDQFIKVTNELNPYAV